DLDVERPAGSARPSGLPAVDAGRPADADAGQPGERGCAYSARARPPADAGPVRSPEAACGLASVAKPQAALTFLRSEFVVITLPHSLPDRPQRVGFDGQQSPLGIDPRPREQPGQIRQVFRRPVVTVQIQRPLRPARPPQTHHLPAVLEIRLLNHLVE